MALLAPICNRCHKDPIKITSLFYLKARIANPRQRWRITSLFYLKARITNPRQRESVLFGRHGLQISAIESGNRLK
jgi:hypothetical protein